MLKVKSTRKNVTKKYVFIDEHDKDIEVEFKYFALSTEQGKKFQECEGEERLTLVMEFMKENLRGPEPYKSTLLDYFYSEGNMFEEFSELQEMLGKQKLSE